MSSAPRPPVRHICMPPPALRALVRYFHVEQTGACHVLLPATPYPMVTFFISGGSVAQGRGYSKPFLSGPMTASLQAHWLPGTGFVSAICEPARFGELFGVDLRALRDNPAALEEVAPGVPAGRLQAQLHGPGGPAQWVAALGRWLLELARPREERVLRAFAVPPALLMALSGALAQHFGLSVRQFERRHGAAYGLTLRESRSMARYASALGLLIRNGGRRGMLTAIACAAGYHDQAHMIHDFQRYLGLAPGGLLAPPGAPDDDVLRLLRYDAAQARIVAGSV